TGTPCFINLVTGCRNAVGENGVRITPSGFVTATEPSAVICCGTLGCTGPCHVSVTPPIFFAAASAPHFIETKYGSGVCATTPAIRSVFAPDAAIATLADTATIAAATTELPIAHVRRYWCLRLMLACPP